MDYSIAEAWHRPLPRILKHGLLRTSFFNISGCAEQRYFMKFEDLAVWRNQP